MISTGCQPVLLCSIPRFSLVLPLSSWRLWIMLRSRYDVEGEQSNLWAQAAVFLTCSCFLGFASKAMAVWRGFFGQPTALQSQIGGVYRTVLRIGAPSA